MLWKFSKLKYFIPILCFFVALVLGVNIYKDYGLNPDSQAQRADGGRAILCINEKFNHVLLSEEKANNYAEKYSDQAKTLGYSSFCELYLGEDKFIGVWFEFPLIAGEYLLGLKETQEIYQFRHLMIYISFVISLIFFYHLILQIIPDYRYALLGCIILFLTPRIFAHSFYNSKDIPFMITYIIAGYAFIIFLKNKKTSTSIFHGITSGATMAIRIPGIFIFVVSISHFAVKLILGKIEKPIKELGLFLIYIFSFLISLYILYPILWEQPIERLTESFNFMANHPLDDKSLFMKELIHIQDNPWYYLPIWFVVTTPIILILFYSYHLLELIRGIPKYLFSKMSLDEENIFLIGLLFLGPWLAVIILGATVYNGWRHLFFTYPFFIIGVVWSIKNANNFFNKRKMLFLKYFIPSIFSIYLIFISYTNFIMHPYQEVYFNKIIDGNIAEKFEMDYWGLSFMEGFKRILDYKKEGDIKIYTESQTISTVNLNMFSSVQKDRIVFTESIGEADYFFIKYGKGIPTEKELRSYYPKLGEEVFSILTYNELKIMGCYKVRKI